MGQKHPDLSIQDFDRNIEMKYFIKKLVIFVSILVLISFGAVYLSHLDSWRDYFARITDSSGYLDAFVNGSDEIKPYILKVQEQDSTEVLILGDSICHQMFEDIKELNQGITIAASNAAITMAGQYILAKEYLENHANAKEIYLVVHPTSLKRTFDTSYGYQYIIMPFSETETIDALEEETISICEEVYGKIFLNPKVVYMINKSGMNRKLYLNMLQKYGKSYEEKESFEIADIYISKIYEMCKEQGVAFYLLSTPVSEGLISTCEELEEEYRGSWMEGRYPDYFSSISYFNQEQAKDFFHFSGKYEEQEYLNEKIKEVFKETSLIKYLNLTN